MSGLSQALNDLGGVGARPVLMVAEHHVSLVESPVTLVNASGVVFRLSGFDLLELAHELTTERVKLRDAGKLL